MSKILKKAYEKIWVPGFGRLLSMFIPLIEGEKPKEKLTYKLDNK